MRAARSLHLRFARNDLVRAPGVNLSLGIVLVLCAFLAITGSMVMERMFGSIDELFEDAQPPHFLQMHKGEYDQSALEAFAADHDDIESWFVLDMVGFDGSALSWSAADDGVTGDFSDHLIDNLFITQNQQFDHLLDEKGRVPEPKPGQVYAPVVYQHQLGLQAGYELQVATASGPVNLTIAGFVRDAQMASSLSSSTRFVVSDDDFAALRAGGGGTDEIIVEYLLDSPDKAGSFQQGYEAADGVPKTGQAVTYDMIRLINAFSDGMLALGLVLIASIFMLVAFISQRFVVHGTLQDQVRQIGAMKAIGLPNHTIAQLFAMKYVVMATVAGSCGLVLAVVVTPWITRDIAHSYAPASFSASSVVAPAVTLIVFLVAVLLMCRMNLRAVNRVDAVTAMVHGKITSQRGGGRTWGGQRRRAGGRRRISTWGPRAGDASLILNDLRHESGQWALPPLVLFFVTLALVVPTNILSTFESPQFVTYLGAPARDIRADVHFSDDAAKQAGALAADLRADERVTAVEEFGSVKLPADSSQGLHYIQAEVGDFGSTSLAFTAGAAPQSGEIALSTLNAERFEVGVGDSITLQSGTPHSALRVSGIYQDVTSGGYTARLAGPVPADASGYVLYVDLVSGADPAQVARDFAGRHPAAAVIPMQEYVKQTTSSIVDAFRTAVILSAVLGLSVAGLIVALFLQLRISRDRRRIGVLSALGYRGAELAWQYLVKSVGSAGIGIVAGVVVAATAGEFIVGFALIVAGLGLSSFSFVPWGPVVYVMYPALLGAVIVTTCGLMTRAIRSADKSSWLKG